MHYRVLEKIGAGRMGVVYKVEEIRLGRPVPLKFLPEKLTSGSKAMERFQREARAAAALNHANIRTVYDVGEYEGRPFLVMEYVEGSTLRRRIDGKPPDTGTLLDVGIQISSALETAHAKGIIHRDIKPGNIYITSSGRAKVLDFGLAKRAAEPRADSGDSSTRTMAAGGRQRFAHPRRYGRGYGGLHVSRTDPRRETAPEHGPVFLRHCLV